MKQSRMDVSGNYAGAVTRLLAHWVDISLSGFLFVAGSLAFDYIMNRIAGIQTNVSEANVWRGVAAVVWLFIYWWGAVAMTGKTPGKALLGLRVLNREGELLSSRKAAVRAIFLPVSYLLFGFGFLGIILGKERRALHDVVAGSSVVYDWGPRTAQLPSPISAFVDRRAEEERAIEGKA